MFYEKTGLSGHQKISAFKRLSMLTARLVNYVQMNEVSILKWIQLMRMKAPIILEEKPLHKSLDQYLSKVSCSIFTSFNALHSKVLYFPGTCYIPAQVIQVSQEELIGIVSSKS